MKETLMSCVQGQMTHLETVDTKELGEVIDMVKDLSEAIYYCTITEAMEGKDEKEHHHYYTEQRYYPMDMRMMDRDYGKMYYDGMDNMMYYSNGSNRGNNSSSNGGYNASARGNNARGGSTRGFHEEFYERELPFEMRDEREGRSHMSRKTYMEAKEMHQDKNVKLKELEKYMQELSNDMVEMIQGATPEEKQLLEKRLTALGSKIGQING